MKEKTAFLFLLLAIVSLVLAPFILPVWSHGSPDDMSDIEVSRDDHAGNFEQQHPCIDLREDGSFIVVWSDSRNGDSDIYCQIYNPSGERIDVSFPVNDDNTGAEQRFPRVKAMKDGFFAGDELWSFLF